MTNLKNDWPKHIAAQKDSGLTANIYCQQKGISLNSFYNARHQFRNPSKKRNKLQRQAPVKLVEVRVPPPAQQSEHPTLRITKPDGCVWEFFL
jgi:hypothetical protein